MLNAPRTMIVHMTSCAATRCALIPAHKMLVVAALIVTLRTERPFVAVHLVTLEMPELAAHHVS